jgi:flagellar hook-associated protein 1
MANLLASLNTAANSMKAYEEALMVVQNNVTNSSTPGYVRQQVDLVALAFQPDLELTGGVESGSIVSTRNLFSERAVWQQSQRHGTLSQLASQLEQIEPVFDVTSGAGISGAIDKLYATFSQWSVTPNDIPARQNVLRQAEDVASTFRFTATSVANAADHSRRVISDTVSEINQIAGDIRDINIEFQKDFRRRNDAGLNASLYSALESLSQLVDFNALPQPNGTTQILLGGQSLLVIGDKSFELSADLSDTPAEILDSNGNAITSQIHQGKLKGTLDVNNDLLPGYANELDRMVEAFADEVNNVLAGGLDLNDQPPAVDLFSYDAVNGAALSIQVTNITPDQLAGADLAAPGGNSVALNLAGLANREVLDGFTITELYGQLGARLGGDIAKAQADENSSSLLLSQARYLRDQESAVNLDEEAAALLLYQRAYQASAQMIKTLDEMTELVMSLVR